MARRIAFLLLPLVGIAQLSFAQTVQTAATKAATQHDREQDVQVALEMRRVIISDEFVERQPEQLKSKWPKLPKERSFAVLNQEQTNLLLVVAMGDKVGVPVPKELTLTLANGGVREVSPLFERWPSQTYEAKVSDDRQTIRVHLTWAKREDGTETLPVTDAALPLGSHLLVHTHVLSEGRAPVSYWDRLADGVLRRKPRPNPPRLQHKYLLISPRIAKRGSEEKATVEE